MKLTWLKLTWLPRWFGVDLVAFPFGFVGGFRRGVVGVVDFVVVIPAEFSDVLEPVRFMLFNRADVALGRREFLNSWNRRQVALYYLND
jgi:hypothetical protein